MRPVSYFIGLALGKGFTSAPKRGIEKVFVAAIISAILDRTESGSGLESNHTNILIYKSVIRMDLKKIVKKISFISLMMVVSNAHAFKNETHVWVGQEVVNDLLEPGDGYGKLTISPFEEEFVVDPSIVEAIKNNRKAYLMGNVGPDAFPDLIAGQVTTHPGLSNGWKTDDWLSHVLEMGDSEKEIAFKYGYVAHASADFWAHSYVNTYSGGAFDIFNGSLDEEARHILLEGFIAKYTPPLMDHTGLLGPAYANVATGSSLPLQSITETLVMGSSAQGQYSKSPSTVHMRALNGIAASVDKFISRVKSQRSPIDEAFDGVIADILEIEKKIDEILSDPTLNFGLICELECSKTKRVCDFRVSVLIGTGPCLSHKIICEIEENVCKEGNTLGALREQLAPLRDYQYALIAAKPEIEFLYQALLDWREGIDVAIEEYQNTSSRVAVELMKPNGDPMQEIKDWIACHGLTLTGVNTVFVGTTPVTWDTECKIYKSYVDIKEFLDKTIDNHGDVLLGVLGHDLYDLQQELIDEILNGLGEEFLSHVAGDEVVELIGLYRDATSGNIASLMSAQFASSGNVNLLKIDDIESRVKGEMYLKDGFFDPEQYSVAYNSVVLAKLSLLDSSELNRMVEISGGHTGLYGSEVFQHTYPFNVLIGGVKSIDGDFQWLEVAPPYLRNDGWEHGSEGHTGYSHDEGKGFRLYQDSKTRENVFKKIFKGALVPGIELPSEIDSTNVKPSDYPYVVCNSNAYPNGITDQSCALEYLIPIFGLLLN